MRPTLPSPVAARQFLYGGLVLATLTILCGSVRAQETLEYNRDIRPILAEYCFACHGADSAARKGDLRLDQREAAVEAGALAPGKPDDSGLLARINSSDPDELMPPPETKKQLTAEDKATLQKWIAQGAEYQPHWSMIVPTRPELPAVQNAGWVKNPIDQFILSQLEAQGLTPAPEADARALYRRMHLDVTGLPPEPAAVEAFVEDYLKRGDAAYSEALDKLMNEPTWGEHRARYWLDAARYADTHGYHFDNYREMWPYRDWVIRAFNRNEPYDQFMVEQIAGDLLENPTDDQLIATGFQRCNMTTNEGGTIDEENMAIYAVDRVQTFGWVFLGITTNCAQCHDHKFDAFSMRDFYSLAAFFRNTTQPPKDGNVKDGRGPVLMVPSEEDKGRWNALPQEIAKAVADRNGRRRSARADFDAWLAAANAESLAKDLPTEGLTVHVPLNEGSGMEVTDRVQADRKFTASGELAWIPDGRLGAAPVVKAGATIELGDAGDFERNQGFSYGAWIKPAGDASAGIIARMDEDNNYRGWDLWQQGKNVGVHIIDQWPDNALKGVTKAPVLKPGEWQHVFATYDGSGKIEGIRIYVNGQEQPLNTEQNSLKPDASIRTTTPTKIGQRSKSQFFEGGAVQDVRIYSRQLSAAEVKTLADLVPLQSILATAPEQRTDDQKNALYEHYLVTRDPEFPKLSQKVTDLEAERDAIKARSPVTHIQEEKKDSPAMANILARGEYDRPGEQVQANTPAALHPLPEGAPQNRLGLAKWLTDPANPLTARVTVNRFWQQLFGRGIVVTAEDFGVVGALPTNQALLDWMAIEFRETGWDVKRMYKLMLMSSTYRQAAITTPEKLEKDRDNALLSRGPRFRMDAEMVRDYALKVSGLMSAKMYGPGVRPYQPEDIWSIVGLPGGDTRNYVQDNGDNLYRRTLYDFWKRMAPPPNLEAFNAPSREVCTVRRERTNTPLQALVTLNDPQFFESARRLAESTMSASGDDAAKTLDSISLRVLARPLNDAEKTILSANRQEYLTYYTSKPDDAKALINVGESKPNSELDPIQLATWTMICNEVLNLDEALNK